MIENRNKKYDNKLIKTIIKSYLKLMKIKFIKFYDLLSFMMNNPAQLSLNDDIFLQHYEITTS